MSKYFKETFVNKWKYLENLKDFLKKENIERESGEKPTPKWSICDPLNSTEFSNGLNIYKGRPKKGVP